MNSIGDKWTFCCKQIEVGVWVSCPWCGTPKPKEQTLQEKLKLASSDWDSHDWHGEYWDILAKTAEEHFKNNGSLKTN